LIRGCLPPFGFGVDLGDVEDVDVDGLVKQRQRSLAGIVVAGDDPWWPVNEIADAGEDILGAARIGEVFYQLVVDGQVRGQNEEVLDTFGLIQPGDKCSHQAGFTDAGSQGKAETREIAFKLAEGADSAIECCIISSASQNLFHFSVKIGVLFKGQVIGNAAEYLQTFYLGRTQAQAVLDVSSVLVHLFLHPSKDIHLIQLFLLWIVSLPSPQ